MVVVKDTDSHLLFDHLVSSKFLWDRYFDIAFGYDYMRWLLFTMTLLESCIQVFYAPVNFMQACKMTILGEFTNTVCVKSRDMHVLDCTFCCQRLLLRRMKHIWMFKSVFWSMYRSISICISYLSLRLHKPIRSETSRQNSGRVGYRVTEAEVRIASGNLWNIYWHNFIFGIRSTCKREP